MKILWIVNSVLDDLNIFLYNKKGSGVWMEALLADFKANAEHSLVIATVIPTKESIKYEKDGIVYYALPDNYPILYNEKKKKNIQAWRDLLRVESPDIIHVFGTEFTHGLCALRCNKDIPVILHMQGILASLARFYQTGISDAEFRICTLRDFLKRDSMKKKQKKYYQLSKKEQEIICLSKNVISENEWCTAYVKAIAETTNIYYRAESMNSVFFNTPWQSDKIKKYSIGCNASGYPIKGLHILLKAIALLKQKYPQVKLYVPGTPVIVEGGIKAWLRKSGYSKYIEKLIKKLDLQDQVVWIGNKSQEELAKHNSTLHVFVMPSVIENHSNSLKEAMGQGIPCVASAVGGVTYYAAHNKNALLYRPEEFEVLAYYLDKLFQDEEYAKMLADEGRKTMKNIHQNEEIYKQTIDIYQQVLNSH